MQINLLSRPHRSDAPAARILVILLISFCHCVENSFAGTIDLNGNGLSDIWELVVGAQNIDPDTDSDGDGVANKFEAIAGTNPFDTNSIPLISPFTMSISNVTVSMSSVPGKRYELQSSEILCGPVNTNWIVELSMITRTGSVVNLSAPANKGAKFFRMLISDADTDGDGVSDWEEYQLGLNATNTVSNGQLDSSGQLMSDLAFVTNTLAGQNKITIEATDPTAVQPDSGQAASSPGLYTVTRGGFALNSVTVDLGLGGPGTGFATENLDHEFLTRPITFPEGVKSRTIILTPLANTNLMGPVVAMMKLQSGSGYSVGINSNASVVIYPSPTPTGSGLTAQYFTNSSSTYSSTANFNPANLFLTRIDSTVDFVWGPALSPNLSSGNYTVRWTGQVQPQFTETYIFNTRSDDGVRLWVNDQLLIDKWVTQSATDWTNAIALQAGVRYNIKLEYFTQGGSAQARLYWYSENQPKQIIPSARLYPATVPPAPTSVTSPLIAIGFVNQPFSFAITAANSPLAFNATGLPAGLGFNTGTGLISGTPQSAGDFPVMILAANAVGNSASVLTIRILDTGSAVTREVWEGVPGTSISDIPINSPPTITESYGSLEGATNYGDNYAERIRGYITAPATGNYYFWIAGSDAAELWISNDSEPVNKVRRAHTPVATGPRQWSVHPKQKSGWLAMTAGNRYYMEVLHKAAAGTNDNWSVGWRFDLSGTNNSPAGVVPPHLLSRHFDTPQAIVPGTLYTANMLAQAGAISSGVGAATLRLSADESQAVLNFNYSGLTTPVTAKHIHADAYQNKNPQGQIIFDIDTAVQEPDGSFVWQITQSGGLSPADIIEIIKQGKSYINIHSAMYPNGEINGHFNLAQGSPSFTPPALPPAWATDHSNSNSAARFLIQATFGPSSNSIAAVQSLGYEGWIDSQFLIQPTYHLPNVLANPSADPTRRYPGTLTFNTWWKHSVTAPDQLRQRVAFALSEIMVVSENGILQDNARALSHFYDTLLEHSFGNFRELLEAMTLTPAMGRYLDMLGNDKGNITLGTNPNENFAREILQLFSVGLYRLWPDGTLIMNSKGDLIPTYDQPEVMGFSKVFTGWHYYQTNQANGRLPTRWGSQVAANFTNPMVLVPSHHELGTKRLLDNVVIPAAQGAQLDSANVEFDDYCLQDLELALDSIFNNENVGPYVCRQLIQRLVTSHPSRDYVYRVVQKFNDNGAGVRGDMQAVIKAILLDYEARSSFMLTVPTYGKLREPLLRVTATARAFPSPPTVSGTYSQNGNQTIAINTAPTPHRLNNNDDVFLVFSDNSGNAPPPSQGYNNVSGATSTGFNVSAPGLSTGTYRQVGTTVTVTNTGHGLAAGAFVYLAFITGGGSNAVYQVVTAPAANYFTVNAADSVNRSGNCLFPKFTGGGFTVSSRTNVLVYTTLPHGLQPGNPVFINFSDANDPVDGTYEITGVPDPNQFTIVVPLSNNQSDNGQLTYPLVAPPLNRSGTVTVQFSTWAMNSTDGGNTMSLSQTPLNSPTVFNFFFPDYKFPGLLASAGLTTPEFQLTSDTSVALQMNFMQGGVLVSSNNVAGLTSFNNGNGAIMIDINPWMKTNLTSNAGIPVLVDSLSSLLLAGQLSSTARSNIIGYVANTTNFAFTAASPTSTQMRDRVRAVVHLLTVSPEFAVQK